MRGRHALGDPPHPREDVGPHRLVEGADGADEAGPVRDDVVADAGIELADGDDRGLVGDVERARHDRLEGQDDLAAHDDRVDPDPGLRAVRLSALDHDLEPVGRGQERALAVAEDAALQLREDVQAEDDAGLRVVEDPLLQHQLGPGRLLGDRHALLGRLEDEKDLPRKLLPHRHERLRGVEQHRDVGVVATGVHHPDRLPLPGRGDLAGERQVDLLGHRQRVHVGAQGDDRARPSALDHGDDAGPGHTGPRLEPERPEPLGDELRGLDLAVAELGALVQVAAPLDELRAARRQRGVDPCGHRRRLERGGGRGAERGEQGGRGEGHGEPTGREGAADHHSVSSGRRQGADGHGWVRCWSRSIPHLRSAIRAGQFTINRSSFFASRTPVGTTANRCPSRDMPHSR